MEEGTASAPAAPAPAPRAEAAEEKIAYGPFLEKIFKPESISTLRETIPEGGIRIMVHESPTTRKEVILRSIYPFMTLYDIKLALYDALGRSDDVAPEVVFVSYGTAPLEFQWLLPGSAKPEPFRARPPFKVASGEAPAYTDFVDTTGERKIVGLIQRDRILIESLFKGEFPTFNAYLLKGLVSAVPGDKPMSELAWNGRIYPYFPYLSVNQLSLTEAQKRRLTAFADAFIARRNFFDRIESVFSTSLELPRIEIDKVRSLRLVWPKEKKADDAETLFYTLPVTEDRPFMRFIPVEGSPLNKVHLLVDNTPDIFDHKLLVQWARQKNPTKGTADHNDYIFSKFKYRKAEGALPALYGTMRLFERGTGDIIVEPPQGFDVLLTDDHLGGLSRTLDSALGDINHLSKQQPLLGPSDFEFTVEVPRAKPITKRELTDVILPLFSPFFQEIPPLPGTKPLVMLRYKAVDNYVTEKRIFTFLTQFIARKYSTGEADEDDLWKVVATEFQLSEEEARQKVSDRIKASTEIDMIDPEQNLFGPKYNPGIDVAILAKHPVYQISVYRVASMEALERIGSLLSLMLSTDPAELEIPRSAKTAYAKKQAAAVDAATTAAAAAEADAANRRVGEDLDAAAAEPSEAVAPGTSAPAPLVEAVEAVEKVALNADREAELAAAMGDFGNFDYDETGGEAVAVSANPGVAAAAAPAAVPQDERNSELEAAMGDLEDFEEYAEENSEVQAALVAKTIPPAAPNLGRPVTAVTAPALGIPAGPEVAAKFREELAAEEARARATLAPAPKAAAPVKLNSELEEEIPPTTKDTIANYFINKLKEADRRLFDYNKAFKGAPKYVSACQPTVGRQPAVMNARQFRMMRDEYARDGIVFVIYPVENLSELEGLDKTKEWYPVLRYGTSNQKQNYYVCSRYFCTYDQIIVREADLASTKMRKPKLDATGQPIIIDGKVQYRDKLIGQCPFCLGTVIDKKNIRSDARVIERAVKPMTGRIHEFPYPLKKPTPEGWYPPCCFGDEDKRMILGSQPAWDEYRKAGIPLYEEDRARPAPKASAAEAPPPRAAITGKKVQTYSFTLLDVARKDTYIVGQEKMPLEFSVADKGTVKPQIGLLPNPLNAYFNQDPVTLTSSVFNPTRLKEGATGFLRVAVDNSLPRADSLLAAVAAFYTNYGVNTAADLKNRIKQSITLKTFLSLNYGNFAIEFFNAREAILKRNPRPESGPDPTAVELDAEYGELLGIEVTDNNYQAVLRAAQAFEAFQIWLDSPTEKKEYRQFAHFFAQPNFLRKDPTKKTGVVTRGITFVVLDISANNTVSVRCPPYGYNTELFAKNDIGFLMHHWSGIWEPIFHADNRGTDRETTNVYDLLFNPEIKEAWPPIVLDRVREFQSKCSGPSRAAYTTMRGLNPQTLIPLSQLATQFRLQTKGVLRDSYNHVAAAVVEYAEAPILVPVSDDGYINESFIYYMDFDDVKKAPVDKVFDFYTKELLPKFPMYPKYAPSGYRLDSEQIAYLLLENNALLPVAKGTTEAAEVPLRNSLEEDTIRGKTFPEWEINKAIIFSKDDAGDELRQFQMTMNEFQEIYEHLRLTFSNLLRAQEGGAVLRKRLESIIFTRHLPLFEKRKRLAILLQGEIEDLVDDAEGDELMPLKQWTSSEKSKSKSLRSPLLRVDCTVLDEKECNGRCVWRSSPEGKGEEEGQCLLHVPEKMTLDPVFSGQKGQRTVDTFEVLMYRLIDELLRYGERRRQLLDGDVRKLVPITEPTKYEDQVIYPELSAAWFELKQTDWAKKDGEETLFVEEKSRGATDEDAVPLTAENRLPESLITVLGGAGAGGADPRIAALRLLRGTLSSVLTLMGLPARLVFPTGIDLNKPGFSEEELTTLANVSYRPIIQIRLEGGGAGAPTSKVEIQVPAKKAKTVIAGIPVIVVLEDGSTAVLMQNPDTPRLLSFSDIPQVLVDKLIAALR